MAASCTLNFIEIQRAIFLKLESFFIYKKYSMKNILQKIKKPS